MTPVALKRLLSMNRRELWGRMSMAGQREASRVAFLARRPRWRREALIDALSDEYPGLDSIRRSLVREDWHAAHLALMEYVVDIRSRFVIAPGDRAHLAGTINRTFPLAAEDAVARANRIVNGQYDLLGYNGLNFGGGGAGTLPDWHLDPVHSKRAPDGFWTQVPYLSPESGDHKIIWELNRHQSWLVLGRAYWLTAEERFRQAFIDQFESWIAANPPLAGVNWASMLELGFRSLSWLWAVQFFSRRHEGPRDASPWLVDLFVGLDRQLRLLERNLSRYFSPNTHLLGEALALYVVGRSLPELRGAARWERIGGGVLIEQISRQIHNDGGHAELSTHYHRYTLDFYLLALAVARRTHDSRAAAFAPAVEALARFARTMADDLGRLPTIGDDDGGSLFPICGRAPFDASDSLQLSAQLLGQPSLAAGVPAEEVIWMSGVAPTATRPAPWPSRALPESGYYVSRSPRGDHLTVDAGRHGFLNGGHAHADALSIALTVRGRPFLIDPGTGCYTIDPAVRDRFRSTRFHNTLTVDGQPQSTPAGPFHWESTTHARALEWRSAEGFDLFAGAHDGYRQCTHTRTVLSRPGCWYVVDRLLGTGVRQAELHWHIAPAWTVTMTDRGTVCAVQPDGPTVWLVTLGGCSALFSGSISEDLGWHAPVYGQVLPTTSIRAARSDATPFALVTVIVESDEEPAVATTPLYRESGESVSQGVAFTVRSARWRELVLFTRWSGQPTECDHGGRWIAGGLSTNARLVCWRESVDGIGGPAVLVDGIVERSETLGPPVIDVNRAQERDHSCAG